MDAEIVAVDGPVGVWARDCDNTKWNRTYGATATPPLPVAFLKFMEWLEGVV